MWVNNLIILNQNNNQNTDSDFGFKGVSQKVDNLINPEFESRMKTELLMKRFNLEYPKVYKQTWDFYSKMKWIINKELEKSWVENITIAWIRVVINSLLPWKQRILNSEFDRRLNYLFKKDEKIKKFAHKLLHSLKTNFRNKKVNKSIDKSELIELANFYADLRTIELIHSKLYKFFVTNNILDLFEQFSTSLGSINKQNSAYKILFKVGWIYEHIDLVQEEWNYETFLDTSKSEIMVYIFLMFERIKIDYGLDFSDLEWIKIVWEKEFDEYNKEQNKLVDQNLKNHLAASRLQDFFDNELELTDDIEINDALIYIFQELAKQNTLFLDLYEGYWIKNNLIKIYFSWIKTEKRKIRFVYENIKKDLIEQTWFKVQFDFE